MTHTAVRRSALVTLAALLGAAWLSLWHASPPAPLAADAAETEFSAERARAWLRILTSRPHPTGSPAQEEIIGTLAARLGELGLEVQIQETTAVSLRGPVAARVRNVLARLPGTESGKPVVLIAHHDAVPNSHGAGDDGSGVVTLLETARALRAGPPLRNDVILAFTDAEELGLLGAIAFVSEHEWGRDAGVALNFEGRGSRGAVSMFQTSSGNGRLIRELAAVAPHPVADSLLYEVYKRLPNDTDLTVFLEAGVPAMNFAFIDGYARYHAPVDDFESLDAGTLQHMGSYALALTRRFGDLDLTDLSAADRVYFTAPVYGLIHYPVGWAKPLAAVTLLLLLGLTVMSVRLRQVRWRSFLLSLFMLIAAAGSVAAVAWAGSWAYARFHPQAAWIPGGHPYEAGWAVLALAALCVGGVVAVYGLGGGAVPTTAAWLPVLWIFGALLAASAWWMPGASFLFQWPLLLALGSLEVRLRERASPDVVQGVALALALPSVLLLAPLPARLVEAFGLASSAGGLGALALLLLLLIPQLRTIAAWNRTVPLLGALATTILGVSMTVAGWGWSERNPRQDSLLYALDADTGAATWVSADPQPDAWTRNALGDAPQRGEFASFFLWGRREALLATAPALPLPAPTVELLADVDVAEGRELLLQVRSARGASGIDVYFEGETEVLTLEIDGKATRPLRGPARLLMRFDALPAAGAQLRVRFAGAGPSGLVLVDRSFGLPDRLLPPRPPDAVPRRFVPNEISLVRAAWPLPVR